MPAYKFESESDSEPELAEKQFDNEVSDDGEPGPDDTFHFRQSFSKLPRRQHHHPLHHATLPIDAEDMNESSFQTDQIDEDVMEESYDEMQHDIYSDEEEEPLEFEGVDDGDEEFDQDPLVSAVRIEKRATWLEQIEYTDRAIKRLKAIDTREKLQNSKIHWGGRVPEIKYSTEDLERDLFGESPKVVSCA